jgi:hypothetical protein
MLHAIRVKCLDAAATERYSAATMRLNAAPIRTAALDKSVLSFQMPPIDASVPIPSRTATAPASTHEAIPTIAARAGKPVRMEKFVKIRSAPV